jgi:N-carbamoylputrescine amidase
MNILRVALLQMSSHGVDQASNLEKGDRFCRGAKAIGADIALFPEMWNIGYSSFCDPSTGANDLWLARERRAALDARLDDPELDEKRRAWQERAVGVDSEYVSNFRELARDLDMAIALTYLETWSEAPRNALSLIDRRGEILFTYAKVHTCDFDYPEAALTPGDEFFVVSLETAKGPVYVGAMICFDREFPESARILMLKGAEIILTPNACGLGINRLTQFRARSFENLVGVAMTNYAAPDQNGHSVAYDGIPFDDEGNDRDMLLIEAGQMEGIFAADFDLDALRNYRLREPWGNAFRRPHRYQSLTSADITSPFIRTDSAGARYSDLRR